MATNIFVYWLDGLGDRVFDHHTRNGGGAFANKNWPGGGGLWLELTHTLISYCKKAYQLIFILSMIEIEVFNCLSMGCKPNNSNHLP